MEAPDAVDYDESSNIAMLRRPGPKRRGDPDDPCVFMETKPFELGRRAADLSLR
jgi:hypothetical protein